MNLCPINNELQEEIDLLKREHNKPIILNLPPATYVIFPKAYPGPQPKRKEEVPGTVVSLFGTTIIDY